VHAGNRQPLFRLKLLILFFHRNTLYESGCCTSHLKTAFAMVPALLFAKAATARYPVMNMIADDLVQKYQQASCEQLWEKRAAKQGHLKSQR
jgi:hypothetical protein